MSSVDARSVEELVVVPVVLFGPVAAVEVPEKIGIVAQVRKARTLARIAKRSPKAGNARDTAGCRARVRGAHRRLAKHTRAGRFVGARMVEQDSASSAAPHARTFAELRGRRNRFPRDALQPMFGSSMLGSRHAAFAFDRAAAPAAIIAELDTLRTQSETGKGRRSKLTRRAIFATVYLILGAPIVFFVLMVGFAALGAFINEQTNDETLFTILTVLGIGLGILQGIFAFFLTVMFFIQRARATFLDLDPDKLAAAKGLLTILAPDARPGAQARVFVDFRSPGSEQSYASPTGQLYMQRWLHCVVPLADRSTLRLDASVRMKRRERRKPKYTKKKETYQDIVDLRIGIKKGTLPQDAPNRIQSRFAYAFPRMIKCRATPNGVSMRFAAAPAVLISGRGTQTQGIEQRIDARKLLGLVMRSYRSVMFARAAAQ